MTYTYPIDPSNRARDRLRGLMQRAKTAVSHDESLRMAIFGDSTWTCPGGSGIYNFHQFVLDLGALFGNTAGTQLMGLIGSNNAPFIMVLDNGFQADPFDNTQQPPIMHFAGLPGPGETVYPPSVTMDLNCDRFAQQRVQAAGYTGFPAAGTRLEIYAARTNNSCPTLRVQYRPTDRSFSLFEAQVGSDEVITVPNVAGTTTNPELIRVTTQAYTPPGNKPRPCWFLRSGEITTVTTGTVAPMVLGGVRILNANPVGCMVDCFSGGGYSSTTWFGDSVTGAGGQKNNSAGVIAQIPHDVWIFCIGLNDFYSQRTAAFVRRNYYDADGAAHTGMVGSLIAAREARGLRVPLIVFMTPPFRADAGSATYAADKAQHDAFAVELQGLVDELQAAGYDAILRDTKTETDRLGFNASINDFQGCTVRGAYDTNSVSYAVDDIYTGTDGRQYRCIVAHTSSTTTEPTDNGVSNVAIQHRPVHLHLAGDVLVGLTGTDVVHWSVEGATLVADSFKNLFADHFSPASTQLSETVISDIANAVAASAVGTNAATAATQATLAATEIGKVPRAAVAMAGGDDFAWNAVTDTAGKLTLNITEEEA